MNFRGRFGRFFGLDEQANAYKLTFRAPVAERWVLPDLAEFCRAAEPAPPNGDLFVQGRAAGRRDVWLRIQEHIQLTEDELYAVLRGRSILKPEDFPK